MLFIKVLLITVFMIYSLSLSVKDSGTPVELSHTRQVVMTRLFQKPIYMWETCIGSGDSIFLTPTVHRLHDGYAKVYSTETYGAYLIQNGHSFKVRYSSDVFVIDRLDCSDN